MARFIRWTALILSLVILLPVVPVFSVQAAENGGRQAADISRDVSVTNQKGFYKTDTLFDGDSLSPFDAGQDASLTLEHSGGLGSVYIVFDIEHGAYTVTNNDTGESCTWGDTGILHEILDLEGVFGTAPQSVTIQFNENKVMINEMRIFSPGQVPEDVQRWELPRENGVDMMLFSTHGDDEQLFFAGMLPYYAGELNYEVLVVYMTAHRNLTKQRAHEMLNGLWAVGVTTYPVFGPFIDFFTQDKTAAYSMFALNGFPEEDIIGYVVENLRRYKPKVAVGHDPMGEYRHGQHMVYSEVLQKAVQSTMDPAYYPELAEKYGVWDVPKTYLHLYAENPIVMDWDQPLERFDGMTAYEVTKHIGFPCHQSQTEELSWYMRGADTAVQVANYSPCEFGLFRSTVGEDVQKNDFFENVLTYGQERLKAEEEAARLEAERLAEEERHQAEEAARLAAERQAREEQERLEAQRIARENAARKQKLLIGGIAAAVLVAAIAAVTIVIVKKRRT